MHRDGERQLQLGERGGRRGVARCDDELDALGLEKAADLGGETPDLGERPRAVRQAGTVAEVDEVLVRHRDEALVENGEPTDTGVEHTDRAGIHARQCRTTSVWRPVGTRKPGAAHDRAVRLPFRVVMRTWIAAAVSRARVPRALRFRIGLHEAGSRRHLVRRDDARNDPLRARRRRSRGGLAGRRAVPRPRRQPRSTRARSPRRWD